MFDHFNSSQGALFTAADTLINLRSSLSPLITEAAMFALFTTEPPVKGLNPPRTARRGEITVQCLFAREVGEGVLVLSSRIIRARATAVPRTGTSAIYRGGGADCHCGVGLGGD